MSLATTGMMLQDYPEPLVSPQFAPKDQVEISDSESVIVVNIAGVRRAYPTRNLLGHGHVVNDTVAGNPICVAWCDLIGKGSVYSRRLEGLPGMVLDFGIAGVSGTQLWLYAPGLPGIWGQLTGQNSSDTSLALTKFPYRIVSGAEFKTMLDVADVYIGDAGQGAD